MKASGTDGVYQGICAYCHRPIYIGGSAFDTYDNTSFHLAHKDGDALGRWFTCVGGENRDHYHHEIDHLTSLVMETEGK